MSHRLTPLLAGALALLFACGGGSPPAQNASGAGAPSSSSAATAPGDGTGTAASASSSAPSSSAAAASSSSSSDGTPTNATPPPPADPTVTLTNAGRDPKSPLRWHVSKGSTQQMIMTMAMKMGSDTKSVQLPSMKVTMDVAVTDVSADGLTSYDYKIVKVDSSGGSPEVAAKMTGVLQAMNKLSGHVVVTDRGFVRESTVSVAPGAGAEADQIVDNMKQSMGEAVAPLPAEPVGVGATWDVTKVVKSRGIAIQQVAHYELVARTGDRGKMKTGVTQNADPQPLPIPGSAGTDVHAMLDSLTSTGSGSNDFDLTKIAPPAAKSHVSTAMAMDVLVGSQNVRTKLQMDIDVKLESK